jgi:hypothetical protein
MSTPDTELAATWDQDPGLAVDMAEVVNHVPTLERALTSGDVRLQCRVVASSGLRYHNPASMLAQRHSRGRRRQVPASPARPPALAAEQGRRPDPGQGLPAELLPWLAGRLQREQDPVRATVITALASTVENGYLAVGIVAEAGPHFGWRAEWRALLRELRRHPRSRGARRGSAAHDRG